MGAGKGRGVEPSRKGTRESRAQPDPDANAELHASIKVIKLFFIEVDPDCLSKSRAQIGAKSINEPGLEIHI